MCYHILHNPFQNMCDTRIDSWIICICTSITPTYNSSNYGITSIIAYKGSPRISLACSFPIPKCTDFMAKTHNRKRW